MSVAATMKQKLHAALHPVLLEIIDDSEQHRGHAGFREGGETHFTITIIADYFEGLSRIKRHQQVHKLLKEELAGPVHALSLNLQTPKEAAK